MTLTAWDAGFAGASSSAEAAVFLDEGTSAWAVPLREARPAPEVVLSSCWGMIHEFEDFELDEALFELRHRGERVALQARVWKTIAYLLKERDRVVDKGELLDQLWAGTTVSETAVSQVIMLARKALRDDLAEQRIIQTVRGRGFRFVARVETRHGEPATPVRPAGRSTLIGRDAELAGLEERLRGAERGHGELVLIEGEPGIGKSSLVSALADAAAARGMCVVWGRAWEEGGAPPFWPFVQVLRGLLAVAGPSLQRALAEPSFAQLRAMLPELSQPGAAHASDGMDGSHARFRFFDAFTRLLRALTAGPGHGLTPRPLLLILDDLHAVDHASLQLLRFLAPELAGMCLLVVGTFRDLELAGNAALSALVGSLRPGQRMRLSGLSPVQIAELLARRLGRAPAPREQEAVQQLCAGNPLLALELAGHAQATGAVDLSDLAGFSLPERISVAVLRQTAALPEQTRQALEAASALGREFALPLLAAVLACDEAALIERLEPALRRGLVIGTQGRHMFSHATVCRAIYSSLSATARIELHRRAAVLLEAGPPESLPLYEIAHHYQLAAAGGARQKAIELTQLAAEHALGMQADEVAAQLFDRAYALGELEGADGERQHLLLMRAGNAWYSACELERAAARFDRAAQRAQAESRDAHFVQATMLACAALRGTLQHDALRREQLQRALRLAGSGDSIEAGILLAASAIGMRAPEVQALRRETAARGVAMVRRMNSPEALQWVLNVQHFALWGAAHPLELREIADEMVALGAAQATSELQLDALMWRLNDSTELGQLEPAMRDYERYCAAAERSRSPFHRYTALLVASFHFAASGDLARASALSEQALRLGQRIQEPLAEAFFEVRRLFLALEYEAGDGDVLAADPPACVPQEYRMFWAVGWARAGRAADAQRILAEHASFGLGRVPVDGLRRPTLAALGELSVLLGDAKSAGEIYRLLQPDAGLHMVLQAAVYVGPVSYVLGRLAQALGQHTQAEQHFAASLAECENTMMAPYRVRSQHAHASLLASRQELLAAAHAQARSLGLRGLQ